MIMVTSRSRVYIIRMLIEIGAGDYWSPSPISIAGSAI